MNLTRDAAGAAAGLLTGAVALGVAELTAAGDTLGQLRQQARAALARSAEG